MHVIAASHELFNAMYAGVIFPDVEGAEGKLVGRMFDECGYSELSNVVETDDEFRYTKRYQHREDFIHYSFRFDQVSRTWIGQYDGEAVGNGVSRCIITPISKDFFDPNPIVAALGKRNVHEWRPGSLDRFLESVRAAGILLEDPRKIIDESDDSSTIQT